MADIIDFASGLHVVPEVGETMESAVEEKTKEQMLNYVLEYMTLSIQGLAELGYNPENITLMCDDDDMPVYIDDIHDFNDREVMGEQLEMLRRAKLQLELGIRLSEFEENLMATIGTEEEEYEDE